MWGVGFLLVYYQEFRKDPLEKEVLSADDSAIVMITQQPSDDEVSCESVHTPVVDTADTPLIGTDNTPLANQTAPSPSINDTIQSPSLNNSATDSPHPPIPHMPTNDPSSPLAQ